MQGVKVLLDHGFQIWKMRIGHLRKIYQHCLILLIYWGNGSNRVVFDVGGNNYRVICKYWFGITRVHLYVKWIGTHAEYDKICALRKQYNVNEY